MIFYHQPAIFVQEIMIQSLTHGVMEIVIMMKNLTAVKNVSDFK